MNNFLNNNNNSTDSSDSDEVLLENESRQVRIGSEYQVLVPDMIPQSERNVNEYNDKALLVWSPTPHISDVEVDHYVHEASELYGYNGEQALGMLFWHKYDMLRAKNDLANFTPHSDEWTLEDKALFQQAISFHGKMFHRVQQMLPDKTMSAIVKYYYLWKSLKGKSSSMERPKRIVTRAANSTNNGATGDNNIKTTSDGGTETDSSEPEKEEPVVTSQKEENTCTNCGVMCNVNNGHSGKGSLCKSCADYQNVRKMIATKI